ncbi:conserved membrane hypothetical protein [Candidatus Sulfopaludibacter sp. SbA3]|nr:conserved membrane hypothetical protein [Candidatus Sulfopaludibacter sp. SbA3]
MNSEGVWGALVRHFFDRFFDKESLSPQGDPEANIVQTLGFLAAPGAFVCILFQLLTFQGWDLVSVRCFFISLSMIVMSFIVVFEWDALFPDRRDYQVLTPLPLRLSTLFLAKTVAIGIFLGIFLLDVNFFSILLWGGIEGHGSLLGIVGAHVVTVVLSGLFAALAMAAVQGVLITILPAEAFRRVSVCIQTLLMAALVMLIFLSPMIANQLRDLLRQHSPLVYCWPPYWFAGFYEGLRPAVKNPGLLALGPLSVRALAAAAALFLLTYLPGYRSHARKMLEAPQPSPAGPGRISRAISGLIDRHILRHPVQQAVFHFINQTITRSMKHRLFLAAYAGVGGAFAVFTFGTDHSGSLKLPLTLSFILVSAMRAAFNFPSELRGNWAFQLSETNNTGECLAAMRKWIVMCAILPLFAVLAPVEFLCFPWTAALFHLAFGITLSVLLMELMFFDFRKVPFTCSYLPGKINLVGLVVIYCFGFTFYSGTMASLEEWLAVTPIAAAAFFAAAAIAYVLLDRWRERLLGGEPVLDFEDPGDPEVRTLELHA